MRLTLALLLMGWGITLGALGDPAPPPGRAFIAADYTAGKITRVDASGKVTWEHPAKNCNDCWPLPNGNLLFSTGHGVLEVTPDKAVVFRYESKSEIFACQRLPNGNTFVGECNAGRLIELTPEGKVAREVRLLPEGKDGGHSYTRNCRVLATGNYLVTHYGAGMVREYDPAGKVVWEVKAPGGPHSAVRLANGNTLITVGDGVKGNARVFEADQDGKVVWEVSNKDLADAPLKFIAGVHRLPNGNTVICNWLGHGQFGKAPHLIEVTREKKVVWTYADHAQFKTIASVFLSEDTGDVVKGEVRH